MDGSDFLNLAVRLSNSKEEADLRTAVSRAYHGAFHLARELVEKCGVTLPKAAQAHDKLQWCLSESRHPDAAVAAVKLGSLRADRNEVDYDMRSVRFQSRLSVPIVLRAAQEVATAISICGSERHLESFRVTVRTYAKDHLQLPLTGD